MRTTTLRRGLWLCTLYCLLCLFCPGAAVAKAAPALPVLQSHVNDYAHVLPVRGAAIEARLKAFEAQTGHQVYVLTVDSLGGEPSIEAYALAVFEHWQPGRKGHDDGALLVVATGERKMRIESGYGLEDRLTDLESARIIREVMAPRFQQGDMEGGVADGVNAMLTVIAGKVPASVPASASQGTAGKPENPDAKWVVLGLAGFFLLFGLGMLLFAGVFGLLASVAVAAGVVMATSGDWRGWLGAIALVLVWLWLRWRLVAANVRKYHLPKARSKTLAWLKVLLFSIGFARGGPQRKRKDGNRDRDDSSSGSNSGSSDSSDADSGASGGGGRSGGGGASGSW